MQITLYRNTEAKNKVSKILDELTALTISNATMIQEEDLMHPVIRVQTSTDLKKYNYAHIDYFGRYYFMNVECINPNLYNLYLTTDVLKSAESSIKGMTCTVIRSASNPDAYMVDGSYKTKAYKKTVTRAFPNAMTDDTIILMTVGNKPSP